MLSTYFHPFPLPIPIPILILIIIVFLLQIFTRALSLRDYTPSKAARILPPLLRFLLFLAYAYTPTHAKTEHKHKPHLSLYLSIHLYLTNSYHLNARDHLSYQKKHTYKLPLKQ